VLKEAFESADNVVAGSKVVTTVEAVVIKADGRRVDYGVIASSNVERVPVSVSSRKE
jgi:predicted aspartyl protease